jgi:hypothetical protein
MAYNGLPLLVKQGGTSNSTATAYAPIIGGTTSTAALQSVALGASGTVLKSSGSSAVPTWGFVNSWKFLASRVSVASSAKRFDSIISSTYFTYALIFTDITSDSGTPSLKLQVSTDNGGSNITTNYQSGATRIDYNSTTYVNINDTTFCYLSMPIGSGVNASGIAILHNVGNGGTFQISGNSSNGNFTQNIMGYNTATTVNSIKIFMDSPRTYSGTLYLYGIKEF